MSVPNAFSTVKKIFDTGVFNLKTREGQGAFTDAVVSALHATDPRWGHLKKKPGQSNEHGHGEDAALYLREGEGQSIAVDFIGGAGGSNPQPAWQEDIPRYSVKDWADPTDHGFKTPITLPPVYPTYEALGGDDGGKKITRMLEADYTRAGLRGLDGDCGAWQQRVSYDFLTGICKTVEESIAKHRKEWCATLGINVE